MGLVHRSLCHLLTTDVFPALQSTPRTAYGLSHIVHQLSSVSRTLTGEHLPRFFSHWCSPHWLNVEQQQSHAYQSHACCCKASGCTLPHSDPFAVTSAHSQTLTLPRLQTVTHQQRVTFVHSQTVTLPHLHTVALSHPQTVTLSPPQTVTLSRPQTVTPSHLQFLTASYPQTLTVSHPQAVTLSHSQAVTPFTCPHQQHHYSTQSAAISEEGGEDRASKGFVKGDYSVEEFSPDRIRNFSIIAHVDHGKSTLADRLLEKTGAISKGSQSQYLDKLQVERERGITVKAQTASLVYHHEGQDYLLNLIDTPGHVDFSYEVSRSLAACQGAVLLVDASQGVQAQTVANFFLAFEQGLDIIPAVNKVDLPSAEPEKVVDQMVGAFDMDPGSMLYTSGRAGIGLDDVLQAVIKRIRPPSGDPQAPLRMLLVQAFHDVYKGVVCLVHVVDGSCQKGQKVQLASTGQTYELSEVGILAPEPHSTSQLLTGQVGYIVTGMKHTKHAQIGDTFHLASQPVTPLPGFKPVKAMVYAGLFPVSGEDFEALSDAMDKLTLDDASVSVQKESSEALGPGFRCGFLGMLHMEVFMQRLEQEFGASVVTTAPTVPYILNLSQGQQQQLRSAAEYPMGTKVHSVEEPTVLGSIVTPVEYMGKVMELCGSRRGDLLEQSFMGGERTLLRYQLPLAELAGNFYGDLKARTHGFASFDYEEGPYRAAELQQLDVLVNGQVVDALARMVHKSQAIHVGKALCGKLADLLDRQQFEVSIQAAANGRIIARETLKAMRKNVLAKCYGGDVTRKRKLLEKQKEGKKRLRQLGNIQVPAEVFPELMRTR